MTFNKTYEEEFDTISEAINYSLELKNNIKKSDKDIDINIHFYFPTNSTKCGVKIHINYERREE